MILGGVIAAEKVGWFLLALDKRGSFQGGQLEPPVTRYDFAEYLSVSVETVCRATRDLQQRRIIAWQARRRSRFSTETALEERAGKKPQGSKLLIAA